MKISRLAGRLVAAVCLLILAEPAIAALTSTVRSEVSAHYTGAGTLGNQVFDLPFAADLNLASGTGTNQADLIFAGERTIAASGTDSLDLAGSLTDPFGVTLTFVKIKAIYVYAASTNTNSVIVGNGTNPFNGGFSAAGTWTIPPGGSMMLTAPAAGWTVTAATGDIFKLANSSSGTSVVYDIVLIGTSA